MGTCDVVGRTRSPLRRLRARFRLAGDQYAGEGDVGGQSDRRNSRFPGKDVVPSDYLLWHRVGHGRVRLCHCCPFLDHGSLESRSADGRHVILSDRCVSVRNADPDCSGDGVSAV